MLILVRTTCGSGWLEVAGHIGGFCYTIVLMHVKLKIIAVVVIGLIVASIAYLYITRNNAVIYRYGTAEPNAFLIQNPFRERGPEDEAEKILQELKSGNCERALALPAVDPATIGDRCEKEAAFPMQSWSIEDRQDIGNQVILVYKVYRIEPSDTGSDRTQIVPRLAWIDVEKAGEDRWRTLSYQTYY